MKQRFKARVTRAVFLIGTCLRRVAWPLFAARQRPDRARNYRAYAEAAINALQGWYDPATGLYTGVTWWHSAICLDALIDYMARTGQRDAVEILATTFEKNASNNFLENSYDDMAWWALAWINAFDLVGEIRYLEMARTIFAAMEKGWDEVCGGGVWWNFDRNYKNAIPNELFLLLAVRLQQRSVSNDEREYYRGWATRTWNWFKASGMINADHLVNDGLKNCQNNGETTWTYNQGVILAALAELYQVSGESAYLAEAEAIADAVMKFLVTPEGILREPCESRGCDSNGAQFKGIFMRHLFTLYQVHKLPRYRAFILKNVISLWENNRNEANQFGLRWAGPYDSADASRQSSAAHAINAAIGFTNLPGQSDHDIR
ncbi:MAG TPA: glycoside hydrolase family 76 protein [Ktedonobacteraceae bacterium]|nr:glycoside hydrolase family 76 protein [Ktedonobacteraceae bacterium]